MREQFAEMYFIWLLFSSSQFRPKRRSCALPFSHSLSLSLPLQKVWNICLFSCSFLFFAAMTQSLCAPYFACISALNFSFLLIRQRAGLDTFRSQSATSFYFSFIWRILNEYMNIYEDSRSNFSTTKTSAHAIIIYNYPFRFTVMATIYILYVSIFIKMNLLNVQKYWFECL